MKFIDLIADGVYLIADAYVHPRGYAIPSKRGFHQDQKNLTGDVRKLGNDMRTAIGKHDKQANQRPSKQR